MRVLGVFKVPPPLGPRVSPQLKQGGRAAGPLGTALGLRPPFHIGGRVAGGTGGRAAAGWSRGLPAFRELAGAGLRGIANQRGPFYSTVASF